VRLVDAVLRQGHLSERALVDAIMTGDRPAHLDRCGICAERAVEIGRWLDDARTVATEAADAAFPPERLAAQQAQILRRLEQIDQPSRVIHFPGLSREETRAASDRRVAPAWVGVAAAAGLAVGLVGGQLSARLGDRSVQPPIVAANPAASEQQPVAEPEHTGPFDPRLFEMDLDTIDIPSLAPLNQATPSVVRASADRGGD
jgi:hypothetical protein